MWGGHKLEELKGIAKSSTKWGETFEVSVLAGMESSVSERALSSIINSRKIPYLLKFIDTSDNLSIQVHPGNDYARKFENSSGKTECWVITDAGPGSGIYLGFKPGVTKEEFFSSVKAGEDITGYLNFIPVSRGDYYYIPAGAIHAIGKGITLLEIQQSSGITYRVWDWNRFGLDGKSRELHIKQSFDVLDFSDDFQDLLKKNVDRCLFDISEKELLFTEDFRAKIINLKKGECYEVSPNKFGRLSATTILTGTLEHHNIKMNTSRSFLFKESFKGNLKATENTSFIIVE